MAKTSSCVQPSRQDLKKRASGITRWSAPGKITRVRQRSTARVKYPVARGVSKTLSRLATLTHTWPRNSQWMSSLLEPKPSTGCFIHYSLFYGMCVGDIPALQCSSSTNTLQHCLSLPLALCRSLHDASRLRRTTSSEQSVPSSA